MQFGWGLCRGEFTNSAAHSVTDLYFYYYKEVSYSQSNGWLSPAIPEYSENGTVRLEILPQEYEDDYFNHLVLTDVATNTPKQLTFGKRVVTSIYGWDEENNLV